MTVAEAAEILRAYETALDYRATHASKAARRAECAEACEAIRRILREVERVLGVTA